MPENVEIFDGFTGREYLEYYAGLSGIDPDQSFNDLKELIIGFEMMDMIDKKVLVYSKGMKQKLAIIAAFINKPKILILDEPFDGLDSKAIIFFANILKSFAISKRAILISSHLLKILENLVTRAVIISEGTKLFDGDITKSSKDIISLFLDITNEKLIDANEVLNNLYKNSNAKE